MKKRPSNMPRAGASHGVAELVAAAGTRLSLARQPIVLALAAGLVVVACGGSSKPTSTAPAATGAASGAATKVAPGGTATQATPGTTATQANAGGAAGAQGNGSGGAEFGLTDTEVARRVDLVETSIAACMKAAGFEYVPVDYATARAAMDATGKPPGMKADEFRTKFGYGISTLAAAGASLATTGLGAQNVKTRAALAPADRVAYERTLFGDNRSQTFVVALNAEDFSQTGGCTRAAVSKVFTKNELGGGFVNLQNAQGARVDSDPRVIAAYRDWSTCMRQAGFSYGDKVAVETDLTSRLDAIIRGGDPKALPPSGQAALTALQAQELAIAAADHTCAVKYVDAVTTKVETELLGAAANP